jgi:hypothetical protein
MPGYEYNEVVSRIKNTLELFSYSMDQLSRIEEILNE